MDDRRSIPLAKYATHFMMVTALVLLSWLLMMAVHELGHCLAAWTSGGTVQRVVLHPLSFSRTDVSPNPAPLFVAWAGPVVGVVFPLLLWGVASLIVKQWRWQWLFQFFVVFCLLVNGLYIGLGWTQRVGDAGDMLRLGSEPWQLVAFGVACLVVIFVCGRGLEPRLRPRLAAAQTSGRLACVLTVMLMITVLAMLLFAAKGARRMATSRHLETPVETPGTFHSSGNGQSDYFTNKPLTSLAAIITLTHIERQNHPAFPAVAHLSDASTNSAIPRATRTDSHDRARRLGFRNGS